ncbi:MAG: hypothetical protein ACE5F7_01540 [Nitrospiria bacterium]
MPGRLEKKERGRRFGDLLIAQVLLVVLLYFSVTFFESSRGVALVGTFVLLVGVLYFSWRGMKGLWFKKKR